MNIQLTANDSVFDFGLDIIFMGIGCVTLLVGGIVMVVAYSKDDAKILKPGSLIMYIGAIIAVIGISISVGSALPILFGIFLSCLVSWIRR